MTRRVLLVDDAEDVRTIARLSLERVGGWTVVSAPSGQAALEAVDTANSGDARGGAEQYDAVLLDVMMPGMDGPATLERLREHGLGPAVPVVFLTAKAQSAERRRLIALGAAGVIAKPFDPLTLPAELERVLGTASDPSGDASVPPA